MNTVLGTRAKGEGANWKNSTDRFETTPATWMTKKADFDFCAEYLNKFKAFLEGVNENEKGGLVRYPSITCLMLSFVEYATNLKAVFQQVPQIILSHASENLKNSKKGKHHSLIKGYALIMLKFFADGSNVSPDALALGLGGLPAWMPLLVNFPETRKKLVERLVVIWASEASDEARLSALLALHKAALLSPKLYESTILKKMYATYGKACKALSAHTMGKAIFMLNGLVEILCLNASKAVTFGTKALRALGSLLQASIKQPNKDNMVKVYSWTFVWSLKCWARFCAATKNSSEEPSFLSFQEKVLKLITSSLGYNFIPRFYPYHFHLISAANEVTRDKQIYCPVGPLLLVSLNRIVSTKTSPDSAGKPRVYDFTTICKVPKAEAGSRAYLDCAGEEALFLLADTLMAWSKSPAFPEMAYSIASQLRSIESTNKSWKIAKLCGTLAAKIEQHALGLAKIRVESADYVPKKTPLDAKIPLRPENDILEQFYRHCQRIREQRRKMVASAIDNATYREPDLDDVDEESKPRKLRKIGKHAQSTTKPDTTISDFEDAKGELSDLLSSFKNLKQGKGARNVKNINADKRLSKVRKARSGNSYSEDPELKEFDINEF